MAPCRTTTGIPSPTSVQAMSMSSTRTVFWVFMAGTVGREPGYKVYRGRMRISDLADRVGVPVSTVRYYERIGLMTPPTRTGSGYRDYDEDSATRLLFVSRAR